MSGDVESSSYSPKSEQSLTTEICSPIQQNVSSAQSTSEHVTPPEWNLTDLMAASAMTFNNQELDYIVQVCQDISIEQMNGSYSGKTNPDSP